MKQTNKAIDISLRNHDNRSYLEMKKRTVTGKSQISINLFLYIYIEI